jgi:predicted lipid-binding transport protein (Tim44 family)
MSESSAFIELIILGAMAAIVILVLRNTLGRHPGTGQEGAPPMRPQPRPTPTQSDKEAPPTLGPTEPQVTTSSIDEFAEPGSKLAQSLTEIQLADRNFDPGRFFSGAKRAYEIIVNAFASGDKKALKPLLNEDIFKDFSAVIDARGDRGETVETTFIGLSDCKIANATLTGRIAEVTIRFVTELISVTKNADGAVIDGDPSQVYKVTDIWTFSHDIKSSDPNWKLIATVSG